MIDLHCSTLLAGFQIAKLDAGVWESHTLSDSRRNSHESNRGALDAKREVDAVGGRMFDASALLEFLLQTPLGTGSCATT